MADTLSEDPPTADGESMDVEDQNHQVTDENVDYTGEMDENGGHAGEMDEDVAHTGEMDEDVGHAGEMDEDLEGSVDLKRMAEDYAKYLVVNSKQDVR